MVAMSLKDKALARLSGLNIVYAFDVEGKGCVDPLVFARSLKRFDGDVFTDESVAALLEAIGTPEGGVQLQQFANLVSAAAERVQGKKPQPRGPPEGMRLSTPLLSRSPSRPSSSLVPRSPSCSRHAAVLEDFMDGLICDVDDFRDAVNPEALAEAAGDSPEELEELKKGLTEKAKQFMVDAQRKNIRPIWKAFDRNKDGFLYKEDCTKLVAAYLKVLVPKTAEIVRSTIELGVELSVVMFEKKITDPDARKQMRTQAKRQVDAVCGVVAPLVQETLEKMAAEDPKAIAMELLQDLDADKDGKVTQAEFEERFVEAMQQVLGPDRLMDRLAPRTPAKSTSG
jgi:Ca2+-binding EF-hand superfamily protein